MALEWALLSYVVAAEAILLLVVSMPGLGKIRKGIITMAQSTLQPLLAVIPFCLFLLMDIYWKYGHNLQRCEGPHCTLAEQAKYAKSVVKTERNAILVLAALVLYWLLYNVTRMLVQLEKLNQQVKYLKQRSSSSD
ncbi:hypothetical protein GOP47_0016350 [Adiantum capillus-veneris]|uniref:Endoplasmic reticulum transmembrane protein n=1 Tax=Adiantum capillus-veneris TaxID=13818 RepID=A0A9D4ZBZ7_ADICA|nr:hypothetical protein GOP47_0016350 [Adiantum capillus-veneris]